MIQKEATQKLNNAIDSPEFCQHKKYKESIQLQVLVVCIEFDGKTPQTKLKGE